MSKGIFPSYALITAARNGSQFIESTLKSMVRQTFRPLKWIIVSDGSTYDTVAQHAENHPWIELLRMPERASAAKLPAKVSKGFKIIGFAIGFAGPRWLTVAGNHDVFVADSAAAEVV